jgi:hypothetical protein
VFFFKVIIGRRRGENTKSTQGNEQEFLPRLFKIKTISCQLVIPIHKRSPIGLLQSLTLRDPLGSINENVPLNSRVT